MCKRNNDALFFSCSLIEQLGRSLHVRRGQVAAELGEAGLRTRYRNADILHCEPIKRIQIPPTAQGSETERAIIIASPVSMAIPESGGPRSIPIFCMAVNIAITVAVFCWLGVVSGIMAQSAVHTALSKNG